VRTFRLQCLRRAEDRSLNVPTQSDLNCSLSDVSLTAHRHLFLLVYAVALRLTGDHSFPAARCHTLSGHRHDGSAWWGTH